MIEYLFITSDALVKVNDEVTAYGASARLGSIAPSKALMHLGYDARTYTVAGGVAAAAQVVPAAKRIVFGEMFNTEEGWGPTVRSYRELLALISNPRERVLFSIADDHFADREFRDFYAQVLPECLAVTAVSESLAATVRTLTSRPVLVAPEPCEGRRGAPHAIAVRKPPAPLAWLARRIGLSADLWRVRLLWFGYSANLGPLLELLPGLEKLARRHPLLLTCVTNPAAELAQLMTPQRTGEDSLLRVHFTPWAPFVVDGALASNDAVVIPSAYRDSVKQAKSPNRLVAGLHAGRMVLAHPLPAYAPYREFAWIGEDLCEGIRWAIDHPREVVARVARGQAYLDQRHSPEAVARFWLDVFDRRN
jgi:hypothetical protein